MTARYLPPEPYEKLPDHAERALLAVMWDARRRFRNALDDLNGPHSPTGAESYRWERDRARGTIRDCVAALRVWRAACGGVVSAEYGLRGREDPGAPLAALTGQGCSAPPNTRDAAVEEARGWGCEPVVRTVVVGPWREL